MITATSISRGWRGRGLEVAATSAFAVLTAYVASIALVRSASVAFAVPGLALVGYLLRNWRVAVGLLFVLASVDGFIKHLHPTLAAYALKDALTLTIYVGAFVPVLVKKRAWPGHRSAIVITWFIFVAYLSTNGLRDGQDAFEAIAGFRQHLLFTGLIFVGALAYAYGSRFTKYVDLAIGCITFASAAGIVQYAMGNAWASLSPTFAHILLHYRTSDPGLGGIAAHYYRAFGVLVDPAAMGNAAAFGCVLALASFPRWDRRARALGAVAILTMFAALDFSGARTSMLGLAVGGLTVLFLWTRPENLTRVAATVVAVVFAFAVVAAVAGRTFTVRFESSSSHSAYVSRLGAAERLVKRLRGEPLGYGLGSSGAGGNYSRETKPEGTLLLDDLYLAYLYEGGPGALFLFLVFEGAIFLAAVTRFRRAPDIRTRSLFSAVLGGQLALLASGLTNQGVFDYAPVCQIFWFLCGGLLVDERHADARA
jgi:hypothetical protein